jgi:hypothetical protein
MYIAVLVPAGGKEQASPLVKNSAKNIFRHGSCSLSNK